MRFVGTLVGLSLLLSACSASQTGEAQFRVTNILFGFALDDQQQIARAVTSFRTFDTFHAHVLTEGVTDDTTITGSWWYEDYVQKTKQKVFETEVTLTPEGPVGKFVLTNQNPWLTGTYRFVVSQDGVILAEKTVSVVGN